MDQQAPPSTATATETKPDSTNTETKPAEARANAAVPEKYEFKAPEGAEVDAKLVEAVTPLFKELGITQEAGQKLFDFHTKTMQDMVEAGTNEMNTQREAWRGEVVKDATLGNGTDNLKPEVRANISKALSSIEPAIATAMKEAFDLTGAGDNPAIIRGLNAIGKLLSEGTLVRGAGPAPTGQSRTGEVARPTAAQAMYPNNPSSANSA